MKIKELNLKEITNENSDVIAVKDKTDVLKAAELLEKIGIIIFPDIEGKIRFIETGDDVKNYFLIEDKDGWRIQSHFIGFGASTDVLESRISDYLSKHPNFMKDEVLKNTQDELTKIKEEFQKSIISIESQLGKLKKLIS